jgi:hypothetical protein
MYIEEFIFRDREVFKYMNVAQPYTGKAALYLKKETFFQKHWYIANISFVISYTTSHLGGSTNILNCKDEMCNFVLKRFCSLGLLIVLQKILVLEISDFVLQELFSKYKAAFPM